MAFDEKVFVKALIERPTDARKYGKSFEPGWLQSVELRPVLAKLFEFTQKNSMPPSMNTLRKLFMEEDAKAYEIRYKDILDDLDKMPYDVSEAVHTLNNAREVSIVWSLESLFHSQQFSASRAALDGAEVVRDLRKWLTNFHDDNESVDLRMEEAFEKLMMERGWKNVNHKIPCGISFIDDWTGGGLRPKQLGIIIAPTGHGKSVALSVMAYKMVVSYNKNVLYISNELAWDEVTERFGALFTGYDLDTIINEPTVLKKANERIKQWGIENKLHTWEVRSEITADDIEVKLKELKDLYGWEPDAVVMDYMERMRPVLADGYSRDSTWNWLGAIAGDLVRFAKRNDVLVWSAGQTNRAGMNNKNEQTMEHTQGSIKHLQEASAVISLRSRDDYNEKIQVEHPEVSILEFRALKMRHSKRAASSILVEADLGKMLITQEFHKAADFAGLTEEDKENFKGDPDKMVEPKEVKDREYREFKKNEKTNRGKQAV
jgi:replicative DNA helicase